jgi:L,D-transpeptidase catalytic domain
LGRAVLRSLCFASIAAIVQLGWVVHTIADAKQPPRATIDYRVERLAETGRDLGGRFTPSQLRILEKLNRADAAHLRRLEYLVVPSVWSDDELHYSPFALQYPAAVSYQKLLVVDQPAQAFAAYEWGRLVRWGPVSSGRRAYPTPSGLFHLNWRSRGRHSTIEPDWYMEWYVNFDNVLGLALHAYTLPGYPASHACIRLLKRDAIWVYEWIDTWKLGARGQIVEPGTPLLISGQYAFKAPPPWRSLEFLARGIDLPDVVLPDDVERDVVE